jgi:hypothetical protein
MADNLLECARLVFLGRKRAQTPTTPATPDNIMAAIALAQAERNYKNTRFTALNGLALIPVTLVLFVAGFLIPVIPWLLIPVLFAMHGKRLDNAKDAKYILRAARDARGS